MLGCCRWPRLIVILAGLVGFSLVGLVSIPGPHKKKVWDRVLGRPAPLQIEKWQQCADHGDGSTVQPEWRWPGPGKPPLWIWYDPNGDSKTSKMYDGHSAQSPCRDKNALIRYSCESWRTNLERDFELRLVSTANVRSFFTRKDALPPYFEALPFNHRSDFGSMVLLAEHGGLYLDWDVLVLAPLKPYWDLLRHFEFVGIGGEALPGKGFLEHGLMMARPNNAGLRAGIQEALQLYQTDGGCSGQVCSTVEVLAGKKFLATLGSFWIPMLRVAEQNPCTFLRLPGVHYLPGSNAAITKFNYCTVPKDIKERFELEIIQHIMTKTVSFCPRLAPSSTTATLARFVS